MTIVCEFYSGGEENPQNFQHNKNGHQEITTCNAYWEILGLLYRFFIKLVTIDHT